MVKGWENRADIAAKRKAETKLKKKSKKDAVKILSGKESFFYLVVDMLHGNLIGCDQLGETVFNDLINFSNEMNSCEIGILDVFLPMYLSDYLSICLCICFHIYITM